MLLAGDIGGTKTNLAVFSSDAGPRAPLAEARFASGDYPNLEALVREFLYLVDVEVERASFGVAGPVVAGRATITNLPWVMDEEQLQAAWQSCCGHGRQRKEHTMVAIEASILSADFARLGEQACEAEAAGVDAIQVDVMDGSFVPVITFGPGVVRALRPLVSLPLDVHLMIVEPERHLEAFANAGADRLIVHQETCPHLHRVLQSIHELSIEAGVALNPGTPLRVLEEVLDLTDLIQVMTVNPGWGGQPFLHSQLDKIRRLRRMLDERGLDIPIAVDGGVDPTTAPLVVSAGATVLIAGSSIYNDKASVAENVAALRASVA